MDSFVFNLSGKLRQETREDVAYLVADATLIVPGVLNGNRGPLFYPPEEVGSNVEAWNDMPILVLHPPDGKLGKDVLGSQGIGHVANARFKDNKLRASLWFNSKRTKELEPRIFEAVSTFQKVELSTGLGMDVKPADEGAVFNNPIDGPQKYTHTALNYRPDHVAVLAEAIGACSIRDGCGVNNEAEPDDSGSSTTKQGGRKMAKLTAKQKAAIVNELIENECCWEEEHREELMGMGDILLNQTKIAADKQAASEELLAAAVAGFSDDRGSVTFNQEKKAWERETKPAQKDGDKTVENTSGTEKLTEEQFMAMAPDSLLDTLNYAKDAKQAARQRLIDVIVANVSDDAKPAYIAAFGARPLAELELAAAHSPKAGSFSHGPNHYGGQPPADIGTTTNEADQDDQLIPPEIDWTAGKELVGA